MKKPGSANKIGRKRRAAGWTLLALGVLVAAAWVASGWWLVKWTSEPQEELVQANYAFHSTEVVISAGRLHVVWLWHSGIPDGFGIAPILEAPRWNCRFAMESNIEHGVGQIKTTAISVPLWLFALLTWPPAALFLRSGTRARWRATTGMCTKCGYSLASLGEGALCPECGRA